MRSDRIHGSRLKRINVHGTDRLSACSKKWRNCHSSAMFASEAPWQALTNMKPVILMKSKLPVLEYAAGSTAPRKSSKWGFRFRTAEGAVLIESPLTFRSQSEAERAFLSLIKFIATNQYKVELPKFSRSIPVTTLRTNGNGPVKVKARGHTSRIFVSASSRCAAGWRR